jgi:hypothetical protein
LRSQVGAWDREESTRVVSTINQIAGHIANDFGRNRHRWRISEQTANDHMKRMVSFAQERPDYLRGFVRDYFGGGIDGRIMINGTRGAFGKLGCLRP